MHPSSPWAQWDPTQPGSLKPRLNDDRVILPEDLAIILENSPDCVPDQLLREYLLRALRGELRRPRGRPKAKLSWTTLIVAELWIELEAKDIRAERAARKVKRVRAELEPALLAADRVASFLGNISGAHLRNEISNMKNGRL